MKPFLYLIVFIVIASMFAVVAEPTMDEYYELEQNYPVYRQFNNPDYYAPSNDVVWYLDSRGCKRYTTRAFASRYGLYSGGSYGYPYYRGYGYRYGYYGRGRRFYPNSDYKREVRINRKRGLLTSILEFLL